MSRLRVACFQLSTVRIEQSVKAKCLAVCTQPGYAMYACMQYKLAVRYNRTRLTYPVAALVVSHHYATLEAGDLTALSKALKVNTSLKTLDLHGAQGLSCISALCRGQADGE
eukprot:6201937-Pleurochrysis_carterae.AAC.1